MYVSNQGDVLDIDRSFEMIEEKLAFSSFSWLSPSPDFFSGVEYNSYFSP